MFSGCFQANATYLENKQMIFGWTFTDLLRVTPPRGDLPFAICEMNRGVRQRLSNCISSVTCSLKIRRTTHTCRM
jgi:hypothetical protein